ncbi:unnamed protein product [Effrenium voratum]|nr:unnamed protein product [Effrenium voratum]
MLHHCCAVPKESKVPRLNDEPSKYFLEEWEQIRLSFETSHHEHLLAVQSLIDDILYESDPSDTDGEMSQPPNISVGMAPGRINIRHLMDMDDAEPVAPAAGAEDMLEAPDAKTKEDRLVVSPMAPSPRMSTLSPRSVRSITSKDTSSVPAIQTRTSFIEQGALFQGLQPRSNSKKKRRLSAREKLMSSARPLVQVARELNDQDGLGAMVNPLPGGKCCARTFLNFAEYMDSLQEPDRTGILPWLVNSTGFNMFIFLVVLANTALTIYEADLLITTRSVDTLHWLSIAELIFSVTYVLEFLLKLWVHRLYYFWCPEWKWNIFDALLAILSILSAVNSLLESVSQANMSFLRSFRFIKVSRILRGLRVISFVRQLRLMVSSIVGCSMALFWSCLVLLIVEIVFSILFVQLVTSHVVENPDTLETELLLLKFPSVTGTMVSLFAATTGGIDWMETLDLLNPVGHFARYAFLFYIAFFTIAVFNILTGIFVEKALHLSDQADRAVEFMKQEKEDAQDLRQICNRIDRDGNGKIAWPEFESYMQYSGDGFARLKACGLDVHDVHEFFVSLTNGSPAEYVDIEDFIHHAMRLRGSATSIQVKSVATQMMRYQEEVQTALMWKVDSLAHQLRKLLLARKESTA